MKNQTEHQLAETNLNLSKLLRNLPIKEKVKE
jgi:hypothetical protein